MREREINNWCGNTPITISIAQMGLIGKYGPLLHITQSAGGMGFQHTITPDQAREMAQALTDLAAEAESAAAKEAA